MSLRDDLIPIIDDARAIRDELGLVVRPVARVVRAWSGGELGLGTPTETVVTLAPSPRVRDVARVQYQPGGEVQEGDVVIDRISASLTEAWLRGEGLAAGSEVFWRLDGDEWRLVSLEARTFDWRLVARRLGR